MIRRIEKLEKMVRWLYCKVKNTAIGGIQSIVAGDNITIDNTDPANPVVSSTGGGGTFDGIETVSTAPVTFTGDGTIGTPLSLTIAPVSATQTGIVNNVALQELGGVDKLINGVRVGKGAGTRPTWSTAFGVNALADNTTGYYNDAFGRATLNVNTTGDYNAAFGSYSLNSNTIGIWNTGVGASALNRNTTGQHNSAVGGGSLFHNLTGSHNSTVGSSSGYANNTGSYNTYFGKQSGYDNGLGSYNVGVGALAMIIAGTGYINGGSVINMNRNIFIGANLRGAQGMNDILAIDNKGATVTDAVNSLLYGSFNPANRFLNIGGKLSVTPSYMPTADGTYTKKVLWNPTTGVFAVTNDTASSSVNAGKQRFTGDTIPTKTLTQTPKSNSVSVILNGLELDEQGGDYTVTTNTVTLATAPLTTDVIVIKYLY